MRKKITFLLMLLICFSAYSQHVADLRGRVVDSVTKEPMSGVFLMLKNDERSAVTNSDGEFLFRNPPIGDNFLIIRSALIEELQVSISIQQGTLNNLGNIEVNKKQDESYRGEDNFLVATLDESVIDSDGDVSSQSISALALLSNDPYLSATSYQFSQVRFRPRGYMPKYEQTYLSGVEFNDQIRGTFNYSMLGAMNDMTRNGNVLNYMQLGGFTFGEIGGAQDLNLRAGTFNKGGKVSGVFTNRNYTWRGMASYSTGLMDNGWAISGLVGARYADEGAVKGTFYKIVSFFLALEKQWDEGKHSLSLTTFASPVQRAQESANVLEVYKLTNNNLYNSYWGYQDGKKRSARVVTAYEPVAILSHIFNINKDTKLTSGFGVRYSRYGNTDLNWYKNAADPRPDYYRSLPSYQTSEEIREVYTNLWRSKDPNITQINWANLYEANKLHLLSGDSSALYMLEERRNDLFEMTLNVNLEAKLSDAISFAGGIGARTSQGKTFKTVSDLLGAGYVLDVDKYGERDFPGDPNVLQNDLNNPNRKVVKGDRFGYDYNINVRSANAWFQNEHSYNSIDFYYGAKLTYKDFQRDGKMKNGRNPDNSYGKGERHSFINPMVKAGFVYKLDGRHFIVGNASYGSHAPLPYDAYVSPRVKDAVIPNLESELFASADLGYVFSMPSVKGRISVFQTNFYDATQKSSYFNDIYQTYVHHILTNVNKIHRGIEVGASWKASNNWSFDFGGTVSEYYFSNRPDGTISYENNKEADKHEKVYLKNFYVGGTPQVAGTIGARYFYNYWFIGTNLNGFARSYVTPSPIRRIASSLNFTAESEEAYLKKVDDFTTQSKLKGGMTLDVTLGKMFYLPNRHSLNFNLSVSNVLNNKNIQTGGFEQGRIDLTNHDVNRFPPKYYYMQGINFYLNVGYRF